MKRSLTILGLITALMIPASLAVAQSEDAPVTKRLCQGVGDRADCAFHMKYSEPRLVRHSEAVQAQTGARWGDGPMSSEEAPFQRFGFGPGCDGDCDGDGPYGPFGPIADDAPYGPNGDQDGEGYGPGEAGFGAGPLDGTGPIHDGPEEGTGNQFGLGQNGPADPSQGGPASQHGPGSGGNK